MDSTKRKIPIENVLYMFSYIWEKAYYSDFTNLASEDDFDSANILSTLFLVNVNSVLKRGLYKEYFETEEELRGVKGKVDFKESLNKLSFENAKAFCRYDELSENNRINQIIKTTAYKLYKTEGVKEDNKKKLNNTLLHFNNVDLTDINDNSFKIRYNKNNLYVAYLMNICKLINESCMLSENKGNYKFINVLDDDKTMESIYELFVYNFYKYHLEKIAKTYKVRYQSPLSWEFESGNQDLLPKMRLDILLEGKDKTIIIDTKYYKNALTTGQYGNETMISGNLYQIYAYMNRINTEKDLEGILLYPYNNKKLDEEYTVDVINGNKLKKSSLRIITVDLSVNWREIEKSLLGIIN